MPNRGKEASAVEFALIPQNTHTMMILLNA